MSLDISLIEEQAVRSARFAYRMLLTVCFTAFIFTTSPYKQSIFKSGIDEINTFLSLNNYEVIFGEIAKDRLVTKFLQDINNILFDFNLHWELSPYDMGNMGTNYGITSYSPDQFVINYEGGFYYEATVEDIYRFYSRPIIADLYTFSVDKDFKNKLRDALNNIKNGSVSSDNKVKINLNRREKEFIIVKEDNTARNKEDILANISLDDGPEINKSTITVDVLRSFNSHPQRKMLVEQIEDGWQFLPNIRNTRIWDQVRTELPIQARSVLARQDKPEERSIELFGLSIPRSLISWSIPVIMLAISVYFVVHLKYLNEIATNNPNVSRYPWLVIIPSRFTLIISFVTILILPAIALYSTVVTTWESGDSSMQWFSAIVSALALIFLAYCFKPILAVRSNADSSLEHNS